MFNFYVDLCTKLVCTIKIKELLEHRYLPEHSPILKTIKIQQSNPKSSLNEHFQKIQIHTT